MKLADLIKTNKHVTDYGRWMCGDIDRASWPMRKKKLRQSTDWSWRAVCMSSPDGRQLRVLLRLNPGIERFYAVLGEVRGDSIAILCSHELHTSHGNWHCHVTVVDVDDVFVGVWRDNDSHRRWPSYTGESTVVFDVDRKSALERSARLYRFDLPAQAEMFG